MFLYIPWSLQHKQACCLQVEKVLFLSFQSGWLFFFFFWHFLDLWQCLEIPVLCWVGVVKADIVAFFSQSHGESHTIKYDALCWLVNVLYDTKSFLWDLMEYIEFLSWMMNLLNLVKCFSCVIWNVHMTFSLGCEICNQPL